MRLLAWTLEKKVLSKSALQNLKAELADLKEKKEEWECFSNGINQVLGGVLFGY